MNKLIGESGLGYGYFGSYTKSGDFVRESLGGNNEQADLTQKANIFNLLSLFTSGSPHSSYICEHYANANQGVQCGYRQ